MSSNSMMDKYIVLDMIQVKQLDNGIVFAGKMRFKELDQVYKLTERKEKTTDSVFGDDSKNIAASNQEFFQRQLNPQKIKSIVRYLNESLDREGEAPALFPSSVILYNRPYEDDDINSLSEVVSPNELTEEIIEASYTSQLASCFFIPDSSNSNLCKLYIPRNPNITLIVDGQHRFIGIKELNKIVSDGEKKEKVGNFEFIVTYLYGFDIHEVSKIFADVNFTQKPVNRSLYYDIFGSTPQTASDGSYENEIRLAHDLAVHLNNNDQSPIKGMIKLLGKGHGLFSQAFFVDHLRDHVFKSKIWNDLLIDYLNNGDDFKVIAVFMRNYFSALKRAYPSSWPNKIERNNEYIYSSYYYKNILCKTTGIGAYLRLIKDIYPLIKDTPDRFESNILQYFSKLSDAGARDLFQKGGKYGGRSGESVQSDLYRDLKRLYGLS